MDVWFLLCVILASTTGAQFISPTESPTSASTTSTTTPSTANTGNSTTTPSTANTENITTTPSTAYTENITTTPSTANTENITTTPSTANTGNITTTPSPANTTSTPSTANTTTTSSTANTENITTTPSTANTTTTPSIANTANNTTTPFTNTENITNTPSTANTENITTTPSTANTENITTTPSTAITGNITTTPSPANTTTTPSTANTENITNTPSTAITGNITTTPSPANTTSTPSTANTTTTSENITTTPSTANTENITNTPSTANTENITTTPSTANTENITNTPYTANTGNSTTTPSTAITGNITNTAAAPTTSTLTPASTTTNATSTSSSITSSAAPTTNTTSTSSSTASSAAPTTTTLSTSSSTESSAAPTTTTKSTSSSTASSAAPTRPPPVECLNGGLLLDGVCLCADGWSGDTCSEENFCKAEKLNGLNFPRTPVGWFSYSEELCLEGSGAGKPRATTRCSNNNGSLDFQHPQLLQCSLTLSDILQNITTVEDYEILATSAQILTSRPEELTAENVTTAAEIANVLLLSPNITESARTAAVATVSQLLNARVLDDTEENAATLNLTQTLDELSLNLRSDPNTFESQVVQPNLVVQSAQVSAADSQGVQFTSLTGTSGSFVSDRIQLNTNTSTVMENGFVADALIHVQFAPEAADRNPAQSRVSLGFVLYQNSRFFRSSLYKSRHATVRVLSASVRGQKHRVVPQRVEMMFRPTLRSGTALYDFACVSWNYTLNDWSTAGCSKGNASDGAMRCICNHTTNFATLEVIIDILKYAEDLGLTSIIGLAVPILSLVVTILKLIKDKESLQSNQQVKIALLSLCAGLLCFIITFVTGAVQSDKADDELPALTKTNVIPPTDEHVEQERITCTTVAFLLHLSLLATFMWISLYGHLMMKLTFDSKPPGYWTYISWALGWGLPLVVVGMTMGITYTSANPQGYRQEEFCWLAALDKNKHFDFGKPMFWGMILPGTLIVIYNFVILIRISLKRGRERPDKTSSSFPLAALVGLCCSFGYVVLNSTGRHHTVFSVLLCISAITMGFLFFILFAVTTQSFRSSASRVKTPQVNLPLSSKNSYYLRRPVEKTTFKESYRSLSEDTLVTTQL